MSPSTFCAAMAGMLTRVGSHSCSELSPQSRYRSEGNSYWCGTWFLSALLDPQTRESKLYLPKLNIFPGNSLNPPPFTTTISFHASMFQGPVMVATHLQPPHPTPNPSLAPEAYWEWELEPKVAAKADGSFDFGGNLPFHREHRL